jgi:hypothetical protein
MTTTYVLSTIETYGKADLRPVCHGLVESPVEAYEMLEHAFFGGQQDLEDEEAMSELFAAVDKARKANGAPVVAHVFNRVVYLQAR